MDKNNLIDWSSLPEGTYLSPNGIDHDKEYIMKISDEKLLHIYDNVHRVLNVKQIGGCYVFDNVTKGDNPLIVPTPLIKNMFTIKK